MAVNFKQVPYIKEEWFSPDCKRGVVTMTSYTAPVVNPSFVVLPRERRRKPENLLSGMTNRSIQSSTLLVPRTESLLNSVYVVCSGVGAMGSRLSHYMAMPVLAVPTNASMPNWSLAIRNKLQDDKVSFADAIGEWRESVKLLESSCGILKNSNRIVRDSWRSRSYRRGAAKWFRSTFGRSHDSKLELTDALQVDLAIKFGIKPTIALVEDTASQLDRVLKQTRRVQATVRKDEVVTQLGLYGGTYSTKIVRSARAICYVTYDMDNRNFTTGNLAESLWAGTRLSFVIDWWWNFGSYLSSFNAMSGITSLKGVVCFREVRTGIDRRVTLGPLATVRPGRTAYKAFSRQVFTTLPMASLPDIVPPTTDLGKRLISCLEILATVRRKRVF